MSCVCILTPVVIAAWPAFSAAVAAAATSLGYRVVGDQLDKHRQRKGEADPPLQIQIEVPNSSIVTDQLSRDQQITVTRDGIAITFSRDARGKAELCVNGQGYQKDQLRQWGEELSRRVVQTYVHQRLKEELKNRHFLVVEEEVDSTNAIRLKVRQWAQAGSR